MVGTVAAQLVSLYQTGVLRTLPDPPISVFDSPKVDASNYAYKRFESPDGPIMLVSYGITAWLASAGGEDRARTMPWLPVAMSTKILADVALAVQLAGEEWSENKALCFYCQCATVASLASLALAMPELLKAVKALPGSDAVERLRELTSG
jgi:uncharacterized membrane protein